MFPGDFIEETTTSIAGTLGNGAVTLSALQTTAPGTVRFSNILGTSTARLVHYVIEDITATAGKFEKGIGSVNNNVLTRTSVRATWDGTTYLTTGAGALQFGSTPTSGNIRIRCSAYASSLVPTVPFCVSSIGDDFGLISPSLPVGGSFFGLTFTYAVGTQYFFPYLWIGDGPLVQAACIAGSSGSAGTHIQFSLYEVGSDALPGRLLIAFNSMSLATGGITVKDGATGTWTGDLASLLWLPPGWYWLSWQVDSASPQIAGSIPKSQGGWALSGPMPGFNRATSGYVGSQLLTTTGGTFGTIPNPRSASLSLSNPASTLAVPFLGLKPAN